MRLGLKCRTSSTCKPRDSGAFWPCMPYSFTPMKFNLDTNGSSPQSPHNLLKNLPALLIILELIEARTSRRQQHHIAWLRHSVRLAECVLQGLCVDHFNILNLRFDLRRRRPDRVHTLHPLPQQIIEHSVVAALVLAANNEMDVPGKRLQRLDRR